MKTLFVTSIDALSSNFASRDGVLTEFVTGVLGTFESD